MDKIVEISCLEHIYPDKTKVELCGIEFTVNKGEKVAVLGPNGGGKTTLIKHMLGMLSPSQGQIRVFGVDPAKDFDKIRQRMGVVLQSVEEQLIGPTVLEDIIFSPLNYGYSKAASIEMASEIMQSLEITHLKNKIIHYLSGGEKRKVALAGALVLNPELLILDEPFSGLDLRSQRELINLINKISDEKCISVVISTHDVELVAEFADTMYLISSKKRISRKGTPQEILNLKDELENYNLEEPGIVKLFNLLKEEGFDLGKPITVQEARNILVQNLNQTANYQ
jgi:cobalt/nickel transport system ATP-binding protein